MTLHDANVYIYNISNDECNAMNYLPSKALTAVVVLATGAGAKAAAEPMMVAMIADFILI